MLYHKKIGKAPKHRISMLRNMACSLIKHERIETTDVKAKALYATMRRVFEMFYDNKINENVKKIEIQKIINQKGAYNKFIKNITNKVSAYKGNEFYYYFNRRRYTSNAKMYNIEFTKNPKKRKEQKELAYFENFYKNPMLDYEINLKEQKLYKLLNQHMLLSGLLKKTYQDIENLKKIEEKIYTKHLIEISNKNFEKLHKNLRNGEIEKLIVNEIIKSKRNNPQNGYDFLKLFNTHLSWINTDINQLKRSLSELYEIRQDPEKRNKYNKKFYQKYYKEELKDFKAVFHKIEKYQEIQRGPLTRNIQNLKQKENKKKDLINLYCEQQTEYPEELRLLKPEKISNGEQEFLDSYSKMYNSGDESGLSDLEDLINVPIRLRSLKLKLKSNNPERITNGRNLVIKKLEYLKNKNI